jgi:hypothetical protein
MSISTPLRLVALLAAVATCSSKKEDGGGLEALGKEQFEPRLRIVGEADQPLAGARVSFGSASVTTGADGEARLPAQPASKTTVVTVTADGFAPATRMVALGNAYDALQVTMARYAINRVDADIGGHIEAGTAAVELPGRALLRANGAPYTGPVSVGAAPLFQPSSAVADDLSGTAFAAAAEGPLPIAFLGGIDLQIQAEDGTPLVFAAGERPVVSVALPAGFQGNSGDRLPLWDLDRGTGLWHEVSSCAIQPLPEPRDEQTLACVGTVEHFSAVAVGAPAPNAACFRLVLKLTQPLPPQYRVSFWTAYPGGNYSPNFATITVSNAGPLTVAPDAPLGAFVLVMSKPPYLPPPEVPMRVGVTVSSSIPGSAFPKAVWVGRTVKPSWTVPFAPATKVNPTSCQQEVFTVDASTVVQSDVDHDGYVAPADCDDSDRTVYPGAHPVLCDGKDHDCDGRPDRDVLLPATLSAAQQDTIWNTSCRESRPLCGPRLGPEIPGNRRDENCDGIASDADGDGYFTLVDDLRGNGPADCNDYDAKVHPGAVEVPGNLLDENCDGVAADQDGDGYPSAKQAVLERRTPANGVDCNDLDPQVHPGAGVKDLPVLAAYYQGGTRLAGFCDLFDAEGQPSPKLRSLFLQADRNCNGVPEDLDGDGAFVTTAGVASGGPTDTNDYDPRVQASGQVGSPNATQCSFDVKNAGGGATDACPRLYGREQYCVQAVRDGKPAESLCVARDWGSYNLPPEPYAFGRTYGPCAPGVLPDCAAGSLCAGPISLVPWYKAALREGMPPYDLDKANFTGFCMPVCAKAP